MLGGLGTNHDVHSQIAKAQLQYVHGRCVLQKIITQKFAKHYMKQSMILLPNRFAMYFEIFLQILEWPKVRHLMLSWFFRQLAQSQPLDWIHFSRNAWECALSYSIIRIPRLQSFNICYAKGLLLTWRNSNVMKLNKL